MSTIVLAVGFFSLCFAMCAIGLLFSDKPLKKGCGNLPGQEEGDCICESTGDPNACSSIQEEDLVAAIQRARASDSSS